MANSYKLMTLKQILSPDGRLSRTQYLVHIALIAPIAAALTLWLLFGTAMMDFNWDRPSMYGIGAALLMGPLILISLYLYIKRAHDLGMPAIVVTPIFISLPFGFAGMFFPEIPEPLETLIGATKHIAETAQIGMGFYFLLAPGEKRANRYGPDPLAEASVADN